MRRRGDDVTEDMYVAGTVKTKADRDINAHFDSLKLFLMGEYCSSHAYLGRRRGPSVRSGCGVRSRFLQWTTDRVLLAKRGKDEKVDTNTGGDQGQNAWNSIKSQVNK